MKLLSHRGSWIGPDDRNSLGAFERAFADGYGVETDIRDANRALVISHDPAPDDANSLDELLSRAQAPGRGSLAINIKADGLAALLRDALDRWEVEDAFVFDMSVPDMRGYFAAGIPVYARMSEIEREPAWLERCSGVWLDAFESTWFSATEVERLLDSGVGVCVVSPELHGRPHQETWNMLAAIHHPALALCTDLPDAARAFFGDTT